MPSRTRDFETPSTNTKKMERNTTSSSDQHVEDTDFEDIYDGTSARAVQHTASRSHSLPSCLITNLVNAHFLSTTISLFGPTHSSLTSQRFWLTQVMLELDFILWRPEFLGREPLDAEVECLAEECLEGMWARILEEVQRERGEWCMRKQDDGAGHERCKTRFRRGKRAVKPRRETLTLEYCFGDMMIDESNADGQGGGSRQVQENDNDNVRKELLSGDGAEVRQRVSKEQAEAGCGIASEKKNKRSRYSGCGVTYISLSMEGAHGGQGKEEMEANSRTRPADAGCLLKRILA